MRLPNPTTPVLAVLILCATEVGTGREEAASREPARRTFVGVTGPSEVVSVGSAQPGVIERMDIVDGQAVRKGELLFELTTELEKLEVARLAAIAESTAELREAEAELRQAEREEKRTIDLHERGIAGDADLDKRRREADVARIKLLRAKEDRAVHVIRHREAKARLAQRSVYSPIDGYVAERFHRRGEPVQELAPVLQLIRLDPIWVEFDCPVEHAPLLAKGTKVRVWRDLEPSDVVSAVVVYSSRIADAASQTFRVRVELAGASTWKTGLKVHVEVPAER